jgi:hypothetical protein
MFFLSGFIQVLNFAHWNLPFDWAQGGESFGLAQDREHVENPELVEVVERLVEPFDIWCSMSLT